MAINRKNQYHLLKVLADGGRLDETENGFELTKAGKHIWEKAHAHTVKACLARGEIRYNSEYEVNDVSKFTLTHKGQAALNILEAEYVPLWEKEGSSIEV